MRPRARPIREAPRVALEQVLDHADGLVCLSGCATRGVHDLAQPAPPARGLRRRPPAGRAAAPLPAQRPRPQPGAGSARAASRRAHRRHRRRPRARPRPRPAPGRASWPSASTRRSTPPSRCAAATTPTCSPPRRPWPRASATTPTRWPRPHRLAERLTSISSRTSATATPARRTPRRRAAWPSCAPPGWRTATRDGHCHRAAALRRADEELDLINRLGLAGFFLLHHDLLELAREVAVEVRGPDTARALLPPGRGRGSSVSIDRLLPHRPLARRPDRERPAARALPQRRDHGAARHRPRLPARRARGPDPARARALRARALGPRRRLPDLPRARRHPRAGQGAGAAARGDRTRRARRRRLARRTTSRSDIAAALGPRAATEGRWGWLARWPHRPTACRATSPSTRAGWSSPRGR